METTARSLLSVLSRWWRSLCTFICCLAAFLKGESWSIARGGSAALYHDVKTQDFATAPSPVHVELCPGDDLESGLSPGNPAISVTSLHSSPCEPPGSSTSGLSTTPSTSPALIVTSSVLSPFILEGRGITLSESAKVLLLTGALSPMSSGLSDFSYHSAKEEMPLGESDEGAPAEGGRGPIHPVADSQTWSPSLTIVGTPPPIPFTPSFQPCQNMDSRTTPGGTAEVGRVRDREEAAKGDRTAKASSRPRPPSAVRHSLKFSISPQTFACTPGVPHAKPSIQTTEPALITPSLSVSHSVATFRSLPETSDVFRGALVTEGNDVHLPSSLSAPEPRYYEFYYDYYCQEPVLPLDTITQDAIRKSLLTFSPALVVPPIVEFNDLSVSSLGNAENPTFVTLQSQGKPANPITFGGSPSPWGSYLAPRVHSMESSISASLFAFPTFPSTSVSASVVSADDEDEEGDHELGNDYAGACAALNSPTSSFYVDLDTGRTSGELLLDSDRTLHTVGDVESQKVAPDSSTSSEGSTVGSEDSLALSGEATLVHAKRGSLFKPIVLMTTPGTRESVVLNLDPPPYSERSLTELNGDGTVAPMLVSQGRLTEDRGYSRASVYSVDETFALLRPPSRSDWIRPAKDDEEYDMDDDESDVEWLAWPQESRRKSGRGMKGLSLIDMHLCSDTQLTFNTHSRHRTDPSLPRHLWDPTVTPAFWDHLQRQSPQNASSL